MGDQCSCCWPMIKTFNLDQAHSMTTGACTVFKTGKIKAAFPIKETQDGQSGEMTSSCEHK
ncbi:MAG: hypothetical protein EBT93_07685 [Alphaproteobacteria bacterium]|nr:hypothetical protein [Alphaproteobacteria bacterium]